MDAAKINPSMVQVYSPNARDDFNSMHRLIGDELDALHLFIQTPCTIVINAYEKTPTAFSTTDKILAEYGIIPNISHNDYDNMLKSTSDRLNANLWLDDSLVISGTINKLYSILPREEIYIKYLNVAATPYQYHNIINRKTYNTDYPISYLDTSGNMRMD
jgi:Holliday junction resolvase RusA-like endonuclease